MCRSHFKWSHSKPVLAKVSQVHIWNEKASIGRTVRLSRLQSECKNKEKWCWPRRWGWPCWLWHFSPSCPCLSAPRGTNRRQTHREQGPNRYKGPGFQWSSPGPHLGKVTGRSEEPKIHCTAPQSLCSNPIVDIREDQNSELVADTLVCNAIHRAKTCLVGLGQRYGTRWRWWQEKWCWTLLRRLRQPTSSYDQQQSSVHSERESPVLKPLEQFLSAGLKLATTMTTLQSSVRKWDFLINFLFCKYIVSKPLWFSFPLSQNLSVGIHPLPPAHRLTVKIKTFLMRKLKKNRTKSRENNVVHILAQETYFLYFSFKF